MRYQSRKLGFRSGDVLNYAVGHHGKGRCDGGETVPRGGPDTGGRSRVESPHTVVVGGFRHETTYQLSKESFPFVADVNRVGPSGSIGSTVSSSMVNANGGRFAAVFG